MLANNLEKEIGLLLAALKLINGMVNHSVLSIGKVKEDQTIGPKTSEGASLFNILLVDLISPLGKPYREGMTMLDGLKAVCGMPHFDVRSSSNRLEIAVNELCDWLDFEVTFDRIWLPSIDRELTLLMPRKEFLRHCGNIEKHNTFRLTSVAKKIYEVLHRSDTSVTLKDAYLAIEDFQQWFHEDIFLYHLTKLSEMLNNIVWGIHDYLKPEYNRSYRVDLAKSQTIGYTSYRFDYPVDVTSELGKAFYWDLMNQIRAKPYVDRFKTSIHLVGKY